MNRVRAFCFVGLLLFAASAVWSQVSRPAVDPKGGRQVEEVELVDVPAELEVSPLEPWNEMRSIAPVEDAGGVAAGEERISVLVHFEPQRDRTERPRVKGFAAGKGAYTKFEYEVLPNVINIRNIPRSAIDALKAQPGVAKVEEDYIVTLQHNDSMPLIRALQTQLTGAGHSETGAGVRVCVIDTGIDSNAIMYSTRIDAAAGWDFVNNDSNPEDDNGHGSHVAGTVLGGANITADFACATTGPESMQGVAPSATLIGVKVLSASGSGSASNIIAGINRCASPTLPGGQADVINMSLGGGQFSTACDSDTMAAAANNAVNAGVVVVAAAGNSAFTNALSTPACGSQVISVGAIYDDNFPNCDFPTQTSFTFCTNSFCTATCTDNSPVVNQRVCFSNRSPMLDVAAPGCIIFSDDSTVAAGNGLTGFCGTSQAAPHVAGLAALILDADPTLTPAEVAQIIKDGAVDLGAAGFDNNFGWGRIDAINSLNLASPGCTSDPECSDGLYCNGSEVCVASACQPGTPPNCADSVACTTDSCNESTDSCDHTPNNGACSDGLYCNGSESCHATLGCQAGTPPNCADSVACTTDSCNESTDSCDHTANHAACADGLFCNGSETCHLTLGCQAGSDPCPGQTCDEGAGDCVDCLGDPECDDGLFCNGAESCVAGFCQAGGAPNCNDGVSCTTDSCNEGTDSCDHAPNHGACGDGLYCNGSEVCNETLGCQAGSAPNCDDSVACTDDSCNEGTDSCDHAANNGLCDDGLFCDGEETCHVTLGCQAGSDPCPGQNCDEAGDDCFDCFDNPECDDGMFCNGAEVCVGGFCQAGTAPNCNDGVTCTADSCNEGSDSCDHTPNNAACNDGLFCNGAETCHVTLGCQAGSNPCAGQPCNEATDTCGGEEVWIAFAAGTTVPGVGTAANEDIVSYNTTSGTWSLIFDGSDVGLSSFVIDGVARLPSGEILYSVSAAGSISGLIGGPSGNSVDDSDIIRFTPSSLGSTTSGTHTFHFDGSDVGLTTDAEDVDAITVLSDGRIAISTLDAFSVTGLSGQDEDLIVFNNTLLGSVTSGTFAMYFDGSDVGLSTNANEDADAAADTSAGTLIFSTLGNFSVSGASGADEDVFEFFPTSLGSATSGTYLMFLDLSTIGIATSANVNAVEIVEP